MVVELQVQSFRCPCCGRTYEIRPSSAPAPSAAGAQPQQPKRMTEHQAALIEDYCAESHAPFPQGFEGFSLDQASDWIERNIPEEYIAWRRRKLYGVGARA